MACEVPANPDLGPEAAAPEALYGVKILIVDDNATNRLLLEELLRRWGALPATAVDGVEALGLIEGAESAGSPFSMILLDHQMPGMDGFQLAENLKNRPRLMKSTIMMLSSGGQRGDAAQCRKVGIRAYLFKPFKQSELLEALLIALNDSEET